MALVLEAPILDLLKINDETQLEVTTNGRDLIIHPLSPEDNDRLFEAALKETNRLHGKSLKVLADA
jgi:hypothetical protein